MLAKMKSNPSEHHQKWLGRTALFLPDWEHEQLMVKVTDSKVQGMKASFQLATADDQVWWVDTTTAAGAIMHRIRERGPLRGLKTFKYNSQSH